MSTALKEGLPILPFLQPKKVAGIIVARQHANGQKEEITKDDEGLYQAARKIMDAMHNKDIKSLVDGLREAFKEVDKDEAENPEAAPHTYEAQS